MAEISLKENEIITIIEKIKAKELKSSSHLYKRFPGKLIGEASEVFEKEYCNEAKDRPGLVLLSVILAAHRNYTKQVEPQIDRIRKTNFYSFEDLKQKSKSFYDFAMLCGIRDMEKYTITVQLLDVIDKLKKHSGIVNDYDVLQKWAQKANYMNFKTDIIGRIKGIGIATFQHLRMNFGANTVKPDQRVKEVLNREFKFYSESDIDYIAAVEHIAETIGKSALYADQIFVNYGSGYYLNSVNTDKTPEMVFSDAVIKDTSNSAIIERKDSNKTNYLLKYIEDSICDLDVLVEKRGDGGHIAVANKLKHLTRGKNVFTYWPTSSSVSVIILGLLPRKTYNSVEELERDAVAEKIKLKYKQMVGK